MTGSANCWNAAIHTCKLFDYLEMKNPKKDTNLVKFLPNHSNCCSTCMGVVYALYNFLSPDGSL